jgi:hypothetical protein
MEQLTTPFYADMKFWSLIISILALVLSQLKFFVNLFRRARISVEPYNQIFISHRFGSPNAQLHLVITNAGGRKVRIKGISLKFFGPTGGEFSLPAMSYFQKVADNQAVIFIPFSLLPGEEWAHNIQFLNLFSRQDEKMIKAATADLRANVAEKVRLAKEEGVEMLQYAEPQFVEPFTGHFERNFKWHPDEYNMTISVTTDPPKAYAEQQFRFVLFESDANEFQVHAAKYKLGERIFYNEPNSSDGVFAHLQ